MGVGGWFVYQLHYSDTSETCRWCVDKLRCFGIVYSVAVVVVVRVVVIVVVVRAAVAADFSVIVAVVAVVVVVDVLP